MFAQISSVVARRVQQCLLLHRRLNTCTGQGNTGTFFSQYLHKSPLFSLENPWGFSGNGDVPRALIPFHLQTEFKYFSTNSLESHQFQDDEFSELDERVDLIFREVIGIERRPENKRQDFEIGGMDDLQTEIQVENSKSKFRSQMEIINTLRGTIKKIKRKIAALENSEKQMTKIYLELKKSLSGKTDNNAGEISAETEVTENQEKSTKSENKKKKSTKKQQLKKHPSENIEKQMTKIHLELKKSLSGKTDNNAREISAETEVPENQEKCTKSENKKKKSTKKQRLKQKPSGDSGVGSLEHPWPEWVEFLENLNDSGYLSKALSFKGGPIDLRDCSMERLDGFIRFAVKNFAKDHAEISKLLSGSDLRKVALFGCPSAKHKDVFAAKRLRSFFSIDQGTVCGPCNLKDTCCAPFQEVPKVKSLSVADVVRLLCTFGLNAEKNELSIPDDVKLSVVNLLKELVDFSTISLNGGQDLSLQE